MPINPPIRTNTRNSVKNWTRIFASRAPIAFRSPRAPGALRDGNEHNVHDAISLLVGGIGIMNIMLVSVTERTREIGLRKAMGARKRDILVQFLTESSVLSMIGGLIGIALGWTIAAIVGQIAAASDTAIVPLIGLDAVLLATLFSTAVGLFFGIYPANRVANLEPVEALRYE